MGTGSTRAIGTHRAVYIGKVHEVLPLAMYGADPRFSIKIPTLVGEPWQRHGDNIYTLNADGLWKQRRNPHHAEKHKRRDVSGINALICEEFWYFGATSPLLPEELRHLCKRGPGYKADATDLELQRLLCWLHDFPMGLQGSPFLPA